MQQSEIWQYITGLWHVKQQAHADSASYVSLSCGKSDVRQFFDVSIQHAIKCDYELLHSMIAAGDIDKWHDCQKWNVKNKKESQH